ncbi:MAG TPA: 3-deoxy-manno-octulosonate cytidylyltransferase [Oligoflexia bacterium]|nr:3-deoxy-manno-octulosonate cytidylyltransferase [Oligoflexia bacterium]
MQKKICIVIPARLGSTRLPEKALADIHGKPMIVRVLERARQINGVHEIIVATDHERIVAAVEAAGGTAVMTPDSLQSGTDRVAFVANERTADIFVNVQGDEPLLDPKAVERTLALIEGGRFTMATPAAPIRHRDDLKNSNIVKVLVASDGRAAYFSRFPIPYSRGDIPADLGALAPLQHIGVYAYTRETLLKFWKLERTTWEVAESLEQLRALYHGIPIGVALTEKASTGVDTIEDLERVRSLMV